MEPGCSSRSTSIKTDLNDGDWILLVKPKPNKLIPPKVSKVGKGAKETFVIALIQGMPICKRYSHKLESKHHCFQVPLWEPKFGKFGD